MAWWEMPFCLVSISLSTLMRKRYISRKTSDIPSRTFPTAAVFLLLPTNWAQWLPAYQAPAVSLLKVKDITLSYEGIGITDATFDSFRLMLFSEAEQFQICWLREQGQQCGNLILVYRM